MINIECKAFKNTHEINIILDDTALESIGAKKGDTINFYQSTYMINLISLYKADTGFKIKSLDRKNKLTHVKMKGHLIGIKDIPEQECIYFAKNGLLKLKINLNDNL